jgi:hypothetical protein
MTLSASWFLGGSTCARVVLLQGARTERKGTSVRERAGACNSLTDKVRWVQKEVEFCAWHVGNVRVRNCILRRTRAHLLQIN